MSLTVICDVAPTRLRIVGVQPRTCQCPLDGEVEPIGRSSLNMPDGRVALLVEKSDRSFSVSVICSRLSGAIIFRGAVLNDRRRIFSPGDTIVGKGHAYAVSQTGYSCRAHVVHRILVRLAIIEGILKNSADYPRIAAKCRIPRVARFCHHRPGSIDGIRGQIYRFVANRVRLLRAIGGIHRLSAPPDLPLVSGLDH
jgi:hypothetical protein